MLSILIGNLPSVLEALFASHDGSESISNAMILLKQINLFCRSTYHLLLRKMGMVFAPLHLDVCAVFCCDTSSTTSVGLAVTDPPLRMRRRFEPRGPGKLMTFSFHVGNRCDDGNEMHCLSVFV